MRKKLCTRREAGLQEFRIFMQFPCNRAYALAREPQACYGRCGRSISSKQHPPCRLSDVSALS